MIAIALAVAFPILQANWNTVLACPRVSSGSVVGTGVVIGVKDGFAYLLTANHVATGQTLEVQFSSRKNYPGPAWFANDASVVACWPDPDLALVKFPLAKHEVAVLRLAPAWERPKVFPVSMSSVGVGSGEAAKRRDELILGNVYVKREGKGGAFFWKAKKASESGRSGGPLLDSQGRVIGIAVATRDGSGYFAHHDEIIAALKKSGHEWLFVRP